MEAAATTRPNMVLGELRQLFVFRQQEKHMLLKSISNPGPGVNSPDGISEYLVCCPPLLFLLLPPRFRWFRPAASLRMAMLW